MNEQQTQDRRRVGYCQECQEWRRLNPIKAPYSADVMLWLCDACQEYRIEQLRLLYSGE